MALKWYVHDARMLLHEDWMACTSRFMTCIIRHFLPSDFSCYFGFFVNFRWIEPLFLRFFSYFVFFGKLGLPLLSS